ncbi:MAG: glycosyltransferase [Ignavibacteriae bacterium]|nr:glycosyltransferase [Ignavibacteriota bacterium]
MNNKRIAAVVITFNRITFLKEIITTLREQSIKPNSIIVVNNSSTDRTSEWLREQQDIIIVEQENSGSSGGQYTGIKTAYDNGFDWIWTMDDDVVPERNCLELLLEKKDDNLIRTPLRIKPDGKIFYNDVVRYNLKNPFKRFWQEIVNENHLKEKFIKVEGITFEGPIFHRSLVEKFGLPEKNFFIFGDDTEYFLRTKDSEFRIELIREAKLQRKLNAPEMENITPARKFYVVRNLIAINVKHGNLFVRFLRPFAILLKWIFRAKKLEDFKYICKGFFKGYFYKSENPPFKAGIS